MKTQRLQSILMAALAAGLLGSAAAAAQPRTLLYHPKVGERSVFNQVSKSSVMTEAGDQKAADTSEASFTETELVVEEMPNPPSVRVAVYRTGVERQTSLTENGRDRLADVPEEQRAQQVAPNLAIQVRLFNRAPADEVPKVTDPKEALSVLAFQLRILPSQPVKVGDTWDREIDVGALKATLSWRFIEEKTVNGRPCAIIETSAKAAFTGNLAGVLTIEKMVSTAAEALDGSGRQSETFAFTLAEKGEKAVRRSTRSVETKLAETKAVTPEQLAKAQADLQKIEEAVKYAGADDLDKALSMLSTYMAQDPDGEWTPAVRGLFTSLQDQYIMTKPIPPMRLRAVLKDLQTKHDRAIAGGNPADITTMNRIIHQIVLVNLQTLLGEAVNPDPIVRDLAAFALAFANDPGARTKLLALAEDHSSEVRGTATISLAIQGQAVQQDLLVARLKDPDERVRGGAVLLAARTLKPADPATATVLPLVIGVLKADGVWARANAIQAVAGLAPKGSKDAAAALIAAYKAEKQDALKPAYLAALAQVTDLKADSIEPYEAWLKKPPEPKG
jgi:hypothetical protein